MSRPSFLGCVGGEVLKLRRQAMIWAMLGLALLLFAMVTAALSQVDTMRQQLSQSPSVFMFTLYDIYVLIFDTGAGIVLLIVSARLVGMEYSGGTIRVLLARGAGRLRLLLAKLTALAMLGLLLLAGFLALETLVLYGMVTAWGGGFSHITPVPGVVWTDLGYCLLTALASIAVSILLGAAAATAGRSIAVGIGVALALFPTDNFAVFVLQLLHGVTGQHVWLDLSAYLLGPSLDVLPKLMETDHVARAPFATPLVTVSATHAWLVVAAWAAGLAVAALWLTWRRDVLE